MALSNAAPMIWPPIFVTFVAAIVLIVVSIPLILERVGPNRYYGFRTPKTLSSPEIWYAANSVAGKDLLIAGVVVVLWDLILALLILFSVRVPAPLVSIGVLLLAVTIAVIHSFWALGKM
ncbi:MAG TPA: SdpI family protein [Candidatus Binataceae bacterium]|nr:SdpI family protein [Candidatus Binataceae bacterium]